MNLPSKKFKQDLLAIKQKLMQEIARYLEYGKYEMSKEYVIHYLMDFGNVFTATFNTIRGDEKTIKLYNSLRFPIVILSFDANDDTNGEKDIPFLMELLDYIDFDYREKTKIK